MQFFCRVAESKSFAAAASSLDVVPSALSKAVAALEHELGFTLLNRSTRGLSLTDDGAAYYERCRQIVLDIEEAESSGRSGRAHARGTLRVGMHPSLRFETLTRLGAFLEAEPNLKIETVITNTPAAVVDEGLDVVLHVGQLSDSSLLARQIGWSRSLVCASPGYLAAAGEPRHPEELARHRAVIYARR
ncbi:MAG: LysR family transcriptional regulator, partial [Pseudomonadota bacterium]|nr:LysR family transcriptional regulator [Pseudomonadota bacterium]